MKRRYEGEFKRRIAFLPAWLLMASLVCMVLPGYGAEEILSYEDRIAAELEGHLEAEKVSVVLKGLVSSGDVHGAKEMFCFVRGASIGGLRYDSITIYVEAVSFRMEGSRVVLRHFRKGKVSGSVLLQDIAEALGSVYPAFRIEEVVAGRNCLELKGVYVKNTTIPLKATVGFRGTYLPLEDGTASLHFMDSSSDNPFISTRDIAHAMEKVAPVLSLQSFFPSQKIREVRIAGDTLWFFSDSQGLQAEL
ncbi:MAG TPA: hypothetical protein PLW97_09385 [Synergistaceae bacterium]|nr:hypothetical protein [Synergistaceae bacterium]